MSEQEVFLAAVEISDLAARLAYLDQACAGDPALRQQVEALLKVHEAAGDFLATPAIQQLSAQPASSDVEDSQAKSGTGEFEKTSRYPHDPQGHDDEVPLGFLSPSTKPGSLGQMGHYEVMEILGHGAFGIVLKAFDEKLHRIVAIKVMSPELASTSPPRKRFLREARASAAIRHENVVAVHAVEEQPIPYMVMEYIPGLTLHRALEEHGPLDVAEVLRIGQQIANGLAAAHAQGLIHRDIKPANILLENGLAGRVKITDFGLARAADDASLTQSGTIAGTPMYMSPEQATTGQIDQRSDLFSLGSVMYVMVSGRPPFRAATTLAVLRRVVEDTPRPIPEIIANVPSWLCAIIAKLHAKQPADRFATASEVGELLGKCLADLQANRPVQLPAELLPAPAPTATPIPVEPVVVQQDVPKRNRRETSHQRRWSTIAAMLLLVFVGLGLTEATGVTKLTSTVIRLTTGSGILVIETDDPEIKVTIDGELVQIQGAGVEQVSLKPGKYQIAAVKNGKPVSQQLVTISRGGKEVVRVSMEGIASLDKPVSRDPTGSVSSLADWHGWPTGAPPSAIAPFDAAHAKKHQEAWATYLNVPVEYTNSIGMKFRLIPPGEFMMGCTPEEGEPRLNLDPGNIINREFVRSESPPHHVILTHPIYLGVNEVTQADYAKVMGNNPSHFAQTGTGKDVVIGIDTTSHPVDSVTWNDATEFCSKLSEQEKLKPFYQWQGETMTLRNGTGYRLPTEAEWESSCRAGTTTRCWIGDRNEDLVLVGWFDKNAGGPTHAVRELKANPFGLYDTHGNVWEWVEDWWELSYYSEFRVTSAVNPTGPPIAGSIRGLRGSDSHYPVAGGGASIRGGGEPTGQNPFFGFRVALPVDAVKQALPQTPTSSDPDRRAAEYVLSIGGVVNIKENLQNRQVRTVGDLPGRVFELTAVNLQNNQKVNDVGLAHFQDCKQLTDLDLVGTKVSDAGLAHFRDCRSLEALGLNGTQLTDAGLAHFRDCRNLRMLGLGRTQVSDVGLTHFKDCNTLTYLDLGETQVSDAGLANFRNCQNLATLLLANSMVSDAGLAHFENCRNLTMINLMGATKVTDVGLAHFKDCKDLTALYLSGNQVTDLGLVHFKNYQNLTTLYLNSTKVSNAGLALVKDCHNLSELHLDATQVTDKALEHLKDCKNLKVLALNITQLSDAGLDRLADFQKLKHLYITKTTVTGTGVKKLSAALPRCKIEWDGGVIKPLLEAPGDSSDSDRLAAEWVLSAGGKIQVRGKKQDVSVKLADHSWEPFELNRLLNRYQEPSPSLADLSDQPIELTHVSFINGAKTDDQGLAHLKGCRNLQAVWLHDSPVSNQGLSYLTESKYLTLLGLDRSLVNDVGLAQLREFRHMVVLGLAGTAVSDAGLAHITNCKDLRLLSLDRTIVSDSGLATIKGFTKLTWLFLGHTRVSDTGLTHLRDCKDIEELDLEGTTVSDSGLVQLAAMPKLAVVNLKGTKVTDAGVRKLSLALPDCEIVWTGGVIEATPVRTPDRRAAEYVLSVGGSITIAYRHQQLAMDSNATLPRWPFRLTGVVLSNNVNVSDAGLAIFKECRNVTLLSLFDDPQITDAGLANFQECKQWTHLDLFHTQVTDAGLARFQGCQNLTFLRLAATPISDAGLAHFQHCRQITGLDLAGTRKITDTGLANFRKCKNLQHLVLTENRITDTGLTCLQDFDDLRVLNLDGTQVTDVGLVHLKDCRELRDLSLVGTQVGDLGLASLANCKKLLGLNLTQTKVGDAGLSQLKNCTHLNSLRLYQTQVSDAGMLHLKDLRDLRYLDLRQTRVTDAGLANLKDCNAIAILYLGGTGISDAGLTAFNDCNLTLLDLSATRVSDASLAYLASFPSISQLLLSNTRISLDGYEKLQTELPKCQITWSENNRLVAESVLGVGGKIEIGTPGQSEARAVLAVADLPRSSFQVRRISLSGVTQPLDAVCGQIDSLRFREFDQLESLDLTGQQGGRIININGPVHSLRELTLSQSGLQDADLERLSTLPALQRLVLDGNAISGPGLAALEKQTTLAELSLASTGLVDRSLSMLPKLPKLHRLVLDGNEIRRGGLTILTDRAELTELSLECSSLTDLAANKLSVLKQIKRLSLAGSSLTDVGIKQLIGLTNLESLDLRRTKTTTTGINELKAALPKCQIQWDGIQDK